MFYGNGKNSHLPFTLRVAFVAPYFSWCRKHISITFAMPLITWEFCHYFIPQYFTPFQTEVFSFLGFFCLNCILFIVLLETFSNSTMCLLKQWDSTCVRGEFLHLDFYHRFRLIKSKKLQWLLNVFLIVSSYPIALNVERGFWRGFLLLVWWGFLILVHHFTLCTLTFSFHFIWHIR